jgi:hypothetical protein
MRHKADDFFGDDDPLELGNELSGGVFKDATKFTMDEMKKMVATSRLIPEELKELITVEIAKEAPSDTRFKGQQRRFRTGVFGGKTWAIRQDNFRLVEVLATTALAVTTFATVVGSSPAVFAVTLIIAAVTLADRLRKKGASLSDEQYRILVALKATGPTTPAQLAENLSGLHIYGQNVWTEQRTLDALNILKSVHLGDGTTEALVSQAADGLWAVNGV